MNWLRRKWHGLLRWTRAYLVELLLIGALAASVGYFGYLGYGLLASPQAEDGFSGEQALFYAGQQMEFGPRISGSEGSVQAGDWLIDELGLLGWNVYIQPFAAVPEGTEARNILAVQGEGPSILLMVHYDTRAVADEDANPELQGEPVPGANDAASGVGMLLELARTLDVEATGHEICLVFLDAEDNRGVEGWAAAQGSRFFVASLPELPRCADPKAGVVLDMVGAEDARFGRDGLGTQALVDELWQVAADLGYAEWFLPDEVSVNQEATLFLRQAEVPAAGLEDLDYPFRHTTDDTLSQLSTQTLARVGDVLTEWLTRGAPLGDE